MKLKIKVKLFDSGCLPQVNAKGDWCDLYAAESIDIEAAQSGVLYQKDNKRLRDVTTPVVKIPLGVAMELPEGFEAIVAMRSSSPKNFNIFIPNGIGVIDNTYKGDNDQWWLIASPLSTGTVERYDRVCQFRIQLSQKATVWQKLKWLLSSGIEIVHVESLDNEDRGGIGSTGVK